MQRDRHDALIATGRLSSWFGLCTGRRSVWRDHTERQVQWSSSGQDVDRPCGGALLSTQPQCRSPRPQTREHSCTSLLFLGGSNTFGLWGQGSPEGASHPKIFAGHMDRCAVFDNKLTYRGLVTNFFYLSCPVTLNFIWGASWEARPLTGGLWPPPEYILIYLALKSWNESETLALDYRTPKVEMEL